MAERRPYLVSRLVNGQITLEEARELFESMQRDLEDLRITPPPPGPATPSDEERSPQPAPPPVTASREMNLEELLLVLGPAAGIFAAIMKRSKEAR